MNSDTTRRWMRVKSKLKSRFHKFADKDVDDLEGHMDLLQEKLEKVYGYNMQKARKESEIFKAFLKRSVI